MMHYIKIKAVKEKFHQAGKQITRDGLMALDITMEQIIEKACRQFNGHHKRIDSTLINLGQRMAILLKGKRKVVKKDVSNTRTEGTGSGSPKTIPGSESTD